MKEFIKIFLVLCSMITVFYYGRSFGEKTLAESKEIKSLKSENFENQKAQAELNNLKIKLQNLLDSSDLKKADEILGKIMTIFLTDLNLRLTNEKQNDLNEGKIICSRNQNGTKVMESTSEYEKTDSAEKMPPKIKNLAQFKGAEFTILESENTKEIRSALEKLEVKKIDSLIEGASDSTPEQSKKFLGSYRGTVVGADKKVYGTLVMNIELNDDKKSSYKGIIELFRGGSSTSRSSFARSAIGLAANQSQAVVLDFGGGSSYLQFYKIERLNKIAGIYYDRLPNGTSKNLGTFILSRTDFTE